MELTRFQALFIKYLRIRQEGTWRWVSGEYNKRYSSLVPFSDKLTEKNHQLAGMILCDMAMKLLGEQPEDGWFN